MRKFIGSLVILVSFISTALLAEATDDPSAYLEKITQKMIVIIEKNKEAIKTDPKVSEKLVREHLLPAIDIESFSEKTLGKKTWSSMTNAQHKAFIDGYINQVVNKYAKGLSFYDGQAFEFDKAEISQKSGAARVRSRMKQAGSEPFHIEYYLSKESGKWLIYNLVVEGTNMGKSYKNQFMPRIQEVGMDKFIEELSTPAMAN